MRTESTALRIILMCAMEAVTFKKIILCEMNFKTDTSQKRCNRNKEFSGHNVQFFKRFQRVLYQAVLVDLTVAQKCQCNFNLLTAISI